MNSARQTIERLHRQYSPVLFDLCLRILQDRSAAEDAVQETFMNAFCALDSFSYGDSHLPWLYRIATNTCLKTIRTRKRKGFVPTENMDHCAVAKQRDPVGVMNARRVLEQLVDQLDERSTEILVAHYIGGMDQGQIATSLGISRRAVVKRLTRLRGAAEQLQMESDHE